MATETVNQPTETTTVRPRLGVVAISYNEQRDLPRFLDHLLPWVDEIVIVDDGSTDKTRELAQAAGSKVRLVLDPRIENQYYSHQRNKGIDAATSDWLLHMDIDERVTPELATEIMQAIQDPGKDAYRYRRLNYFLHRPMRGGAWQNWNQVHLARRDRFRFGGMFHETCLVDAPTDRIGQLNSLMHHLNDESYAERIQKSDTYIGEIAAHLASRYESSKSTISVFGIGYHTVRDFLYRYIYKLGFRDGAPGLISACHSATAVFRAASLVWDQQHALDRQQVESRLAEQWSSN